MSNTLKGILTEALYGIQEYAQDNLKGEPIEERNNINNVWNMDIFASKVMIEILDDISDKRVNELCTKVYSKMKRKIYARELLKEVGNWYGSYREENGKYILNNHVMDFIYDTPEEGLIDWYDTMHDSNEDEKVKTWDAKDMAFVDSLRREV